jgi:hypothetical protein
MWAKLIIALAPVALKVITIFANLSKKDATKETPVNLAQKLNEVALKVVAENKSVEREALPALITAHFVQKYPQFSARVVLVLARHWVKTHT